jgi:hypothetical protein
MRTKPNRWNAARDLHDAAIRCPPRDYRPRRPTWSLPLTRVLRWMVAVVLVAFALNMFGGAAIDLFRGVFL